MRTSFFAVAALFGAAAIAAPAPIPQDSGAPPTTTTAPAESATVQPAETYSEAAQSTGAAATGPIPAVRSSQVTGATSHGPYAGEPATTTGALSNNVLAASIAPLPPLPQTYIANGQLNDPQPAPFVPHGGLGTNGTEPTYNMKSDFDYQSIALALYQEWIELDTFHDGLARFSVEDFEAAGLTAEDRHLIEFMANQEVGHSTLLSNMLGATAPPQCTYNYPYTTVREFVDFNQRLTRAGESGVYGFINHLDSREAAQLLLQSISTEARQQMVFRQFDGLFPMPVWFEIGLPQSYAWTLLAPYISSCPENTTRLAWQNFPGLTILNNPNPYKIDPTVIGDGNDTTLGGDNAIAAGISGGNLCFNATGELDDCGPAITQNKSIPLSFPGRRVDFAWKDAGEFLGPNNSYVTSTTADAPRFALWINQLNATYTPLTNITANTASTIQPNMSTYAGDPATNGTIFIALTSEDLYVTPFNLSMVLPITFAGPAIYQAG